MKNTKTHKAVMRYNHKEDRRNVVERNWKKQFRPRGNSRHRMAAKAVNMMVWIWE